MRTDDLREPSESRAQRTGLPQADAESRVGEGFKQLQARMREIMSAALMAAEKARKASSYATLWMFVALLTGAFFASLAGTRGGLRRDMI